MSERSRAAEVERAAIIAVYNRKMDAVTHGVEEPEVYVLPENKKSVLSPDCRFVCTRRDELRSSMIAVVSEELTKLAGAVLAKAEDAWLTLLVSNTLRGTLVEYFEPREFDTIRTRCLASIFERDVELVAHAVYPQFALLRQAMKQKEASVPPRILN